ncbi:MAG: hypothetical protein E7408_05545 [Ruminococcaceae bacterium]|nr:hypothetical protein [Oscillospiraceae bacterium]
MSMYSDATNAENKIQISAAAKDAIKIGAEETVKHLAGVMEEAYKKGDGFARIAIDGWYGTCMKEVAEGIAKKLEAAGIPTKLYPIVKAYVSAEKIADYKQKYITDDPGFGYVNGKGRPEDIMDKNFVESLNLSEASDAVRIVYGTGAACESLRDQYECIVFADITREPMLWQMWDGKLVPFGSEEPKKEYMWKEYYYCDFYMLNNHMKALLDHFDYYLQAIDWDGLKLVPADVYDEVLRTLMCYPIKQVKEFQPGPWGAYRYRDLFHVKGLGCNAWNRLASPELSVLIDVGREECLEMPLTSLMKYNEALTGKELAEAYPDLFPMEIWLDDGYFPEPQPAERISMPIHTHPSTDYVKSHFNEPLGRYETYYIAEAYEGANTWMGFKEDANLEEWEAKCRESKNITPIENWKDYIANHTSNEGDLYLIPPGTVHAHGGNQMVLEMDTCTSAAGTEYSFFEYDFARKTWNDKEQAMTAKPMNMHLDHGFDNEKWCREDYVNRKLRATKKVTEWNKEYSRDEYSTLPEMPFMVERLHFYNRAEGTTDGKPQILTLTVGTWVEVVSKKNPAFKTTINRFQSAILPASFGDFEIKNADGGNSTVVVFSWK